MISTRVPPAWRRRLPWALSPLVDSSVSSVQPRATTTTSMRLDPHAKTDARKCHHDDRYNYDDRGHHQKLYVTLPQVITGHDNRTRARFAKPLAHLAGGDRGLSNATDASSTPCWTLRDVRFGLDSNHLVRQVAALGRVCADRYSPRIICRPAVPGTILLCCHVFRSCLSRIPSWERGSDTTRPWRLEPFEPERSSTLGRAPHQWLAAATLALPRN